MDCISLRGIEVHAHHGVLPAERELGGRFGIDVDLWTDCEGALVEDDLERTVDYAAVHRCVVAAATAPIRQLIEAVAGGVCHELLREFAVERVTVTVRKLQVPVAGFRGTAAVTLTRERDWLDQGKAGS